MLESALVNLAKKPDIRSRAARMRRVRAFENGGQNGYNPEEMDDRLFFSVSGFEPLEDEVRRSLSEMDAAETIGRIWRRDPTVWKDKDEEISNRLGWLTAADRAADLLPGLERFAAEVAADGLTHALLLGMGGSSLAPEVFRDIFGTSPGRLTLDVLDSTDPEAVLAAAAGAPPEKTLVIVSSKSGTTLETSLFLRFFYELIRDHSGRERAGAHFIAITDHGTPLEETARTLGFRRIFIGDPAIGGRFSVFSPFGLVPAALLGLDVRKLIERGRTAARACRNKSAARNPGAYLGTLLGVAAREGRDKLRATFPPAVSSFGAWLEQLVAESTGKEGHGLLPLIRDLPLPSGTPWADVVLAEFGFADDPSRAVATERREARVWPTIQLRLADLYDIGAQFFLWEMATAVIGHHLAVNPFDQPNIAASKKKTESVLAALPGSGRVPNEGDGADLDAIRNFLKEARPGDYIALQAFIPTSRENAVALRDLAARLQVKTGRPVTFDFGPRFLHSTGQLHKGGRDNGLFIQVTSDHPRDVTVPRAPGGATEFSFGGVEDAQARGDRETLRDLGRRVIRIRLAKATDGLRRLTAAL